MSDADLTARLTDPKYGTDPDWTAQVDRDYRARYSPGLPDRAAQDFVARTLDPRGDSNHRDFNRDFAEETQRLGQQHLPRTDAPRGDLPSHLLERIRDPRGNPDHGLYGEAAAFQRETDRLIAQHLGEAPPTNRQLPGETAAPSLGTQNAPAAPTAAAPFTGQVPASPADYKFEVSDKLKPYVGNFDKDPVYAKARDAMFAAGMTDQVFAKAVPALLGMLIDNGLASPPIDAMAELMKLAPAGTYADDKEKAAAAGRRLNANIAWVGAAKAQRAIPAGVADYLTSRLGDDVGAHQEIAWLRGDGSDPLMEGVLSAVRAASGRNRR